MKSVKAILEDYRKEDEAGHKEFLMLREIFKQYHGKSITARASSKLPAGYQWKDEGRLGWVTIISPEKRSHNFVRHSQQNDFKIEYFDEFDAPYNKGATERMERIDAILNDPAKLKACQKFFSELHKSYQNLKKLSKEAYDGDFDSYNNPPFYQILREYKISNSIISDLNFDKDEKECGGIMATGGEAGVKHEIIDDFISKEKSRLEKLGAPSKDGIWYDAGAFNGIGGRESFISAYNESHRAISDIDNGHTGRGMNMPVMLENIRHNLSTARRTMTPHGEKIAGEDFDLAIKNMEYAKENFDKGHFPMVRMNLENNINLALKKYIKKGDKVIDRKMSGGSMAKGGKIIIDSDMIFHYDNNEKDKERKAKELNIHGETYINDKYVSYTDMVNYLNDNKYFENEFSGGSTATGGGVEEGDRVIITTKNLGEKYEGMTGEITSRKLLNNKYSIKLENGMTMAFEKGEFRHNSINPKYGKGGSMAVGGKAGVVNSGISWIITGNNI